MKTDFNTITTDDWRKTFTPQPRPSQNMKALIALCLLGTAKLTASQDLRIINAIAQVESGGDNKAHNMASGCRGAWQFGEATWKQHSKWPFRDAHNGTKAQAVALIHLRWLREQLEADPEIGPGNVQVFHLASAWLRGPNYRYAVESRERYLERIDYAQRVANLVGAENKACPYLD